MGSTEILLNLLQLQSQLRILHWQTESFAEHMAFGNTYESINDLVDKLIEVYSGKYERPKIGGVKTITLGDYDSLKVEEFLKVVDDNLVESFSAEQDSELANIRDDIRAEVQKLKYLLTLK